jgi:putative peptidoglycan lipid II flippase
VATAVSRATGFVRVIVVAAAMGTTFLANTYQTANTAPNLIFELAAAGVLTSVFVPTFVDHLMKGRSEEGWDAANAMASVGFVVLIALGLGVALGAVPVMHLLTLGVDDPHLRSEEIALGARFLRLFAPQIVFYGMGMIFTAALHAHRRFALPAVAPIFNNVVVIGVYLAYALSRGDRPPTVEGITSGEVLILGVGTTLGVVAMTLSLLPSISKIGWRMRFTWNPRHPAVARGARLGVWALGYAGGYQAGLIVVLALANRIEGGVAAYQWAYTFFYLPHALFGVPIFAVLFTAMSEKAAVDDVGGIAEKLRDGLGMQSFLLIPIAAGLFVLGGPLSVLVLNHGAMGTEGAELVGSVLAMFALGLPAYSAFLVLTRAFYAVGETRVPALMNALAVGIASASGMTLFFILDDRWKVPGLAVGHTIGFTVGLVLLARSLTTRLGGFGSTRLMATITRSLGMSVIAAGAAAVTYNSFFVDEHREFVGVPASALVGVVVYLVGMNMMGVPELGRLRALMSRST